MKIISFLIFLFVAQSCTSFNYEDSRLASLNSRLNQLVPVKNNSPLTETRQFLHHLNTIRNVINVYKKLSVCISQESENIIQVAQTTLKSICYCTKPYVEKVTTEVVPIAETGYLIISQAARDALRMISECLIPNISPGCIYEKITYIKHMFEMIVMDNLPIVREAANTTMEALRDTLNCARQQVDAAKSNLVEINESIRLCMSAE